MSGLSYKLVFTKKFSDALKKLDSSVKNRLDKIFDKIKENPRLAKPLHGRWNYYRIRFLSYRLLYSVNDNEKTVIVLEVGKRDEIYN